MRLTPFALLLFTASCTSTVVNGSPAAECDDIEPAVEIPLPGDCYEDELACPQEVPGKPWESNCGRAYMCEVEQPDGSLPFVCVRARDCSCLEEWEEHCGL